MVEATAWSWVAVLAMSLSVLALGVISPRDSRAVQQVKAPVVEKLQQRVIRVPTVGPAPAISVGSAMRQELGPPPGVVADVAPAHVAAAANRYALLVGVTNYHAPTHDTIGAANDVQAINTRLLQQGWLAQNIRVLVDEEATATAVRSGMAWLAAASVQGQTFSLFHYSGHVRQLGGLHAALWPVDDSFIPDVEVAAALGQIRGKAWIDVAGCEAGAFLPGLATRDILVSASSMATEKSYEYPPWLLSVWSGLVFKAGIGDAAADADHSGIVTIGEALRYAAYYAQVITYNQQQHGRQTPQIAGDPVRGWTLSNPPA